MTPSVKNAGQMAVLCRLGVILVKSFFASVVFLGCLFVFLINLASVLNSVVHYLVLIFSY